MKRIITLLLVTLVVTGFAQKKPASDLDKKIKEFDAYTQAALKQWEVPGAGVAIIKDGKVIYLKAFGVRDLNTGAPATTETLFSIGSTTKAMTAVCLGMLVDEGKVNWDDPVVKYLPEFQLYDPYVTRELKVRDLLLHNSGVGNTDFLWGSMNIPSDEILRRMRMVKPSYSFRGGFIYQNVFYIAAGKVIEKVSGQSWYDFIMARIFKPLGMTRTATKLKNIQGDNYTKPHFKVNGKIQVIGHTNDDEVNAAGSVWSSIEDMSKWTLCMLDSTKYPSTSSGQAGGRLLKPATWAEMFKPHTFVTPSQFYPTQKLTNPNWMTYGLGWFQHDYKGHKINFHTGSLSGLIALHAQLPDQSLGYYFLGNYDHAEVRHALMYKAFDLFALGGTRDWSTEILSLYKDLNNNQEKEIARLEGMRVKDTKPSLPLSDYAGKYTDPLYGTVEVSATATGLKVVMNNIETATLEHWNYDTFYGPWEKAWYGKAIAQFTLTPFGKVEKLVFEGLELRKVN
ncbi:MAG: serine hydrolase [Cyclobacteriaceae bacterium]|nr:serine hydrolase [Cyclobacteriaceae bacterium]